MNFNDNCQIVHYLFKNVIYMIKEREEKNCVKQMRTAKLFIIEKYLKKKKKLK